MNKPKQQGPYPDRELDCQMAIEDSVIKAIADAVAAGWNELEAADAAVVVAGAFIMARGGREALRQSIAAAKASLRDPDAAPGAAN